MRRIKLLTIALVIALAGFVYAAGNAQEKKESCCADKAACCASCCKAEDSCCKAHRMGGKSANGQTAQDKQSCCAGGGCECCKDGKSCCGADGYKMDKSGKAEACCDKGKEGGCCSMDKTKTS